MGIRLPASLLALVLVAGTAAAAPQDAAGTAPVDAGSETPAAPVATDADAEGTANGPDALDLDAMARARDGKPPERLGKAVPAGTAEKAALAPAEDDAAPVPPPEPTADAAEQGVVVKDTGTAGAADSAEPDEAAQAPDAAAGEADPGETGQAEANSGAATAAADPDASAPPAAAGEAAAPAAAPVSAEEPAQAGAATQGPAGQETPAEPGTASAWPRVDGAAAPPADDEAAAAQKRLQDACTRRATALLDAAQKNDFTAATRDFDARMRGALPPPELRKAWESLGQFGTLKARGQSHVATAEGYIAVTIPLLFDKANLYAQVACGSDGRIAGFYVKPLPVPAK